jgi:meso-butanediol dehydrogenase / (S,S)-butanediol dehydrogenase / diacetyl reductase
MAEALDTDLDGVFERVQKSVPLHRIGAPDEIAGVCVFLAGSDSSFMTGSTVMVDGGTHFVDAFAATVGDLGLKWG